MSKTKRTKELTAQAIAKLASEKRRARWKKYKRNKNILKYHPRIIRRPIYIPKKVGFLRRVINFIKSIFRIR